MTFYSERVRTYYQHRLTDLYKRHRFIANDKEYENATKRFIPKGFSALVSWY
jgi:hypothetical protein